MMMILIQKKEKMNQTRKIKMPKGVYIRTEKHININRISQIGKFVSDDTKKLLSKLKRGNSNGFKKGNIPWNKGLTK